MSLTAFYLTAQASVAQLETLQIAHPLFSRTYNVVRNDPSGISASLVKGGAKAVFDYYPLRIRPLPQRDNLQFGLVVDLGDLGEVIPQELARVGDDTRLPTITYRTYRSDDLDEPLYGPLTLTASAINVSSEGASFEAHAPVINLLKTGEAYDVNRFPMLRGFL